MSINRVLSPLAQGLIGRALCLFHSRYVSPVLMSWIPLSLADYWPLVVLPGINQMGIVTLNTGLIRQSIWRGQMTGVRPALKTQFGFLFIFCKTFGFRFLSKMFSSVQFSCSIASDSLQPHGLQHARASPSITNSQSLLKLMSIKSVMPSNHLILCRPLLLLPSIFPSIRVFSNESVLRIRRPKYWSFSFSISPSNEYSGLISFRVDWFEILAVQGTLKSLLQYHSSKSINSWVPSFLYSPTLTSIHDYWKNLD